MEFSLPGLTMLEELSSGPVRTLMRAQQTALGRSVVVVCLAPGVRPDSQLGATIKREAEAYAALDHPNIPRLHDFRAEPTQAWLVLEDTGGRVLGQVLSPPLEWRLAVAVTLEVTAALVHAHERGLVHGRVSLEHVLVTPDWRVKLGGFGLAGRGQSGDVEPLELSHNAGISPEGTLGQAPTPAADLFAVGCVLFELLTGQSPFGAGAGAGGMGHDARVRSDRVPSLLSLASQVPPALDALTRRCLEKLPTERPESMADLQQKLAILLAEPASAVLSRASGNAAERSVSLRPRGLPVLGFVRQPLVRGLVLGALGSALLLGALVLLRNRAPQAPLAVSEVSVPSRDSALLLRAVASPWAHVVVDGVRRETTPFATPLLLTPGKHEVRFEHPQAAPEIRHIEGQAGENVFLDVVLRVERPPLPLEPEGPLIDDSP